MNTNHALATRIRTLGARLRSAASRGAWVALLCAATVSVDCQAEAPAPSSQAPAAQQRQVSVYVTEWCPYCKKLEAFLRENQIQYTRYDIEKDVYGARRHQELGGGGIPVILVDDQVIRGFNQKALVKALDLESR